MSKIVFFFFLPHNFSRITVLSNIYRLIHNLNIGLGSWESFAVKPVCFLFQEKRQSRRFTPFVTMSSGRDRMYLLSSGIESESPDAFTAPSKARHSCDCTSFMGHAVHALLAVWEDIEPLCPSKFRTVFHHATDCIANRAMTRKESLRLRNHDNSVSDSQVMRFELNHHSWTQIRACHNFLQSAEPAKSFLWCRPFGETTAF